MQTIPGVGEKTAIYFIIITKGFTAFDSARKLACYAGVAPFECSSGSSIRGKTKVIPIIIIKQFYFTGYFLFKIGLIYKYNLYI